MSGCSGDCYQGRDCNCRLSQHNSDGTDPNLPVMGFDSPWQWLGDLMLTAFQAIGIVAIVVILAGFAGYFWGKL